MRWIPLPVLALLLAPLLAPALGAEEAFRPHVTNARFETASASGDLQAAVRQAGSRGKEPVWVAWAAPMIAGQGYVCCLDRNWKPSACRLESQNHNWGTTNDTRHLAAPDQNVLVLLRLQEGQATRVRHVSENCPLDVGDRRFVWLGSVRPESSVQFLLDLARRTAGGRGSEKGDEIIAALAHHRNANADAALEGLASAPGTEEERETSIFWIGQTRGERGAGFLTRMARTDPDPEIRQKALFSLSQSPAPGAADPIFEAAKADKDPEVRGEALFCLSQSGSPGAGAAILDSIREDPDAETRKKGVFALSQLPKGQGTPLLIRLGRESRDREIRKEALFWLAESDDPAARKFLEEVLDD
jgi:HEAT repeat protein